ncbi:MAG: hypothetical protein MZV63_57685 [Marinilabiliales bacterium]|nr:hypothetical protein [Marinilabiliales bacterium]
MPDQVMQSVFKSFHRAVNEESDFVSTFRCQLWQASPRLAAASVIPMKVEEKISS